MANPTIVVLTDRNDPTISLFGPSRCQDPPASRLCRPRVRLRTAHRGQAASCSQRSEVPAGKGDRHRSVRAAKHRRDCRRSASCRDYRRLRGTCATRYRTPVHRLHRTPVELTDNTRAVSRLHRVRHPTRSRTRPPFRLLQAPRRSWRRAPPNGRRSIRSSRRRPRARRSTGSEKLKSKWAQPKRSSDRAAEAGGIREHFERRLAAIVARQWSSV